MRFSKQAALPNEQYVRLFLLRRGLLSEEIKRQRQKAQHLNISGILNIDLEAKSVRGVRVDEAKIYGINPRT